MSTNKYRQAYASLGEERVQVITKGQAVDKRTLAEIKRGVKFVDTYWDTRFDESWSRMPGYFAKNRKTKQKKFFSHIPRILIKLEPTNTFNPIEKWEEELAMMAELSSQSQANSSSSNSSKMSKKEKIIADNAVSTFLPYNNRICLDWLVLLVTSIYAYNGWMVGVLGQHEVREGGDPRA
jgi:hypothetical protein